jgi:hypothetical protein
LIFASKRGGNQDLYLSARTGLGAPWQAPTLASDLGLNSQYNELQVVFTEDELAIALTTDRPGGLGGFDIWFSTRATVDEPFGALIHDATLNSFRNEFDLHLATHTHRLYFNTQTNASSQILVAELVGPGLAWSAPEPVAGVASPGSLDASPFLTPDERIIFFTSDRAGTSDIWWAVRDEPDLPFGEPNIAPVVNEPDAVDGEATLSEDGCELIFCSNRQSGTSDWEIYTSRVVAR